MSSLFSSVKLPAKKPAPHTIPQALLFISTPCEVQPETVMYHWPKDTICVVLSCGETYARTASYVNKDYSGKAVAKPYLEYSLAPIWSLTAVPVGMAIPPLVTQFLSESPLTSETLGKTEVRPRAGYDWKHHSDLPTGIFLGLATEGKLEHQVAKVVVWKDERYSAESVHPGLLTDV